MNTNAASNNPREAKTKKLSSGTKNTPTADTTTAKPKKPKRVRRRREKKKPQEQPPPPADAIPDAGTRAVSKEKPPPLVPNPPPQLKQPQIIKIETAVKSPVSPSGLNSPTTKSVVVSVLNGTNVVTKNNGIVKPTTSEKPKNGLPELIPENNFEIELEKNYVFRRRKNVKQNDPPRYRCNLCNYFCDSLEIARKHINGSIHRNNMDTIRLEMKIRELSMPSNTRLDLLSTFLVDFYSKTVISSSRLQHGYDIFAEFRAKLNSKYPSRYLVNICGSMSHGVCFADSQCDISVEPAQDTKSSPSSMTIMRDVVELIRDEMGDSLVSVENDVGYLAGRVQANSSNRAAFRSTSNGLVVNFLSGLYPAAHKTSTVLRAYMELDERARVLAFCFRYLAKIAQIDRVEYSTLPSHAFIVMVVYFLQQLRPPVLPVLHEIIDSKSIQSNGLDADAGRKPAKSRGKTLKSRNPNTSGDVEEDDEDQDEIFSMDNDDEAATKLNFDVFKTNLTNYVSSSRWSSQNHDSLGALWLKLLTFYSVDFGFKKYAISVRKHARISKSSLKMYSKKMCIEDPFYLKQSLSKSLITQTNKYIVNVVAKTCLSFVHSTHSISVVEIQSNKDKILDCLVSETGIFDARKANRGLEAVMSDDEDRDDEDVDQEATSSDTDLESGNNRVDDSSDVDDSSSVNDENLSKSLEMRLKINHTAKKSADYEVKKCLDEILDRVVLDLSNPKDLLLNETFTIPKTNLSGFDLNKVSSVNSIFKFTQSAIGLLKSPPKICSHCNKEGHLQSECPQDQMPKLEKLPEMSDKWRCVLDKVFQCIFEDNRQTREEEKMRGKLLDEIKRIVWQKYPQAKLSLFGSSNNGFAMKKSDLDICMTLDERLTMSEDLNFKRIIRNLGALFRREPDFDQIEERVSAKVPIVKFRHKKSMIEGDISLYNTLALQNTDLLRAYAEIDERTKILGYVVKHFAKVCRIGDASCGSLSSYAYIVMMIHYLMNTSPPVLPCLQQLNRDHLPKQSTELIIDGWDCWFNRIIEEPNWVEQLSSIWPHLHANKQSVGQLWLGFLRYYTETFDWSEHVVCIRQSDAPLTRKHKNWTKHRLAIEDPFELSHNLAAGVSHKMGLYILKCFAKARSLFGVCNEDFRVDETRLNINYFFNPIALVDGSPPMDRNCYSCFKIGHQTRDCPLANAKRKEKQRENQMSLGDSLKTDDSNLQCFRCRNYGHRAKECPNMELMGGVRRQKTVSVSVGDYYQHPAHYPYSHHHHYSMGSQPQQNRCYSCNQPGHLNRDCPQLIMTYHLNQMNPKQTQTPKHNAQFFQYPNQYYPVQQQVSAAVSQSAPAPKMISSVVAAGKLAAKTKDSKNGGNPTASSSSSPSSTSSSTNGSSGSKPAQNPGQNPTILQRQQSYPMTYQTKSVHPNIQLPLVDAINHVSYFYNHPNIYHPPASPQHIYNYLSIRSNPIFDPSGLVIINDHYHFPQTHPVNTPNEANSNLQKPDP